MQFSSRQFLWPMLLALLILGVCCPTLIALAQEESPAAGGERKGAAAGQMQAMQRRAQSLRVTVGSAPPKEARLSEAALLRYINPGGDVATADGTVWAWTTTGRPAALAAIFFERLPEGEKWSCELLALADEPVSLQSPASWQWTPGESALKLTPVPGTPAVAESAAARGRQMKALARRFRASESFGEDRTDQLRLMITPLHRYSDPGQRLVDGALFAFASGTNPEALLVLEAIGDEGSAAWHFAFARMGAARCQAHLDDKLVWQCPTIENWDNRAPYYSMFGTDQAVFGE